MSPRLHPHPGRRRSSAVLLGCDPIPAHPATHRNRHVFTVALPHAHRSALGLALTRSGSAANRGVIARRSSTWHSKTCRSKFQRRWVIAFAFGLGPGSASPSRCARRCSSPAPSPDGATLVHVASSWGSWGCGIAVPVLSLLFRRRRRAHGKILLSALVAHTAWHWLNDVCVCCANTVLVPRSIRACGERNAGDTVLLLLGGAVWILSRFVRRVVRVPGATELLQSRYNQGQVVSATASESRKGCLSPHSSPQDTNMLSVSWPTRRADAEAREEPNVIVTSAPALRTPRPVPRA